MLLIAALSFCFAAPSRATDQDVGVAPPFKPYVDMKTFMEHVLTPAAKVVWPVHAGSRIRPVSCSYDLRVGAVKVTIRSCDREGR